MDTDALVHRGASLLNAASVAPDGSPQLDQRREQRRELMAHLLTASTSADDDAQPGDAAESGLLLTRLQGGAALLQMPLEVIDETSFDGVALARWGVNEIAAAPLTAHHALSGGGLATLELLGRALRASTIAVGAAVAEVTHSVSLLAVRSLDTPDTAPAITLATTAVSILAVRGEQSGRPCLPTARRVLNVSRVDEAESPAELAASVRYSFSASAAGYCVTRLQTMRNDELRA